MIRVTEESEKTGLKLSIKKTKIMTYGPITSWQTKEGKVEARTNFIFLGSKITEDDNCSHGIKRCSLLGRKAVTNLDGVLISRDITLPTKVPIVRAMVLPIVIYRCENWSIKTAECQKIDAFKSWCWRRLLRIPWTARRSYQSVLKEISPQYLLEKLFLNLKLQYSGHLIRRANSLEKTLMLERLKAKEGVGRG